jgi:prepilin-type N-terminal cleavage/methylation domain-containing protein
MKPRMLKLMPRFSRGMTLVELLIALGIVAVLVAMAVQGFSGWTRDMAVRGAAESILSGLQIARSEALKRNTPMRFQLVTTLTKGCALDKAGPHWVVSRDAVAGKCDVEAANPPSPPDPDASTDPDATPPPADSGNPYIVQKYDGSNALKSHIAIETENEHNDFWFDGMGRLRAIADEEDIIIGVKKGDDTLERSLHIQLTPGGGARMCNPGSNIPAQKC